MIAELKKQEGSMILSVRSTSVDLSTKWTDLNIPSTSGGAYGDLAFRLSYILLAVLII